MRDMNLKKTLIQYIDILKHKKTRMGAFIKCTLYSSKHLNINQGKVYTIFK